MNNAHILSIIAAATLCSCSGRVAPDGHLGEPAPIYPDYKGVTAPCNIAPLNFTLLHPGAKAAAILACGPDTLRVAGDGADIDIPIDQWHRLLAAHPGEDIEVTVCRRDQGRWLAYDPFAITVSPDSIDPVLAYRLLPPGYGLWREMGLYQRDLQTFKQTPIYVNRAHDVNCVNCHSMCMQSPDTLMYHMRVAGGGTYMLINGQMRKLITKTDSTMSNFTYPYWHPSGRYVAFSVNDIFQVFHTADRNRIEVPDADSDVIIYDIERNEAFSGPAIKRADRFETFPSFSADGRTLYFCSAERPEGAWQPEDVHYSLLSVAFDPATRTIGEQVDTLYDASAGGSISFPRPSPDGRWLVATRGAYGNFSIWHHDADLVIFDLADGTWRPLDGANSPDVESYHSWSRNGRWLAFSSRRDDGLYTRPYFTHIDSAGRASKPIMLPQRHPRKYYQDLTVSYNIPELARGPIPLSLPASAECINLPATQVLWSPNK